LQAVPAEEATVAEPEVEPLAVQKVGLVEKLEEAKVEAATAAGLAVETEAEAMAADLAAAAAQKVVVGRGVVEMAEGEMAEELAVGRGVAEKAAEMAVDEVEARVEGSAAESVEGKEAVDMGVETAVGAMAEVVAEETEEEELEPKQAASCKPIENQKMPAAPGSILET